MPINRNDLLIVEGFLGTTPEGERIIRDAVVTLSPLDIAVDLHPLHLGNREIGGGAFGPYTPGVVGSTGLNNIGLLVITSGRVVYRGTDFFVIDDGGRLAPSGKAPLNGVAVSTVGLAGGGCIPMPPDGSYVAVTGISGCFTNPSAPALRYPLIRPRGPLDVRTIWP